MSTPLASGQKMQAPPHLGIFSGILYFLGVIIVMFGTFAILVTFGTGATIGLIGILLSLVICIASIILFVRLVQQHAPSVHWWQRLLLLAALALATFVLLIIDVLISPSKTMSDILMSCIFVLYGLAWCAIAVW